MGDAALTDTELHRRHTSHKRYGRDDLHEFGTLWTALGKPALLKVWRDTGGGWIRWVAFIETETDTWHGLFIPDFRETPIQQDKDIATALVRLSQ